MGLSTLQKCIVVVLMLTYGVIVNALYEYCCMGKMQPWKVCWSSFVHWNTKYAHTSTIIFLFLFAQQCFCKLGDGEWHHVLHMAQCYECHQTHMTSVGVVLVCMWEMRANKTISKSWHPFLMRSSMVGCNFWEQP